MSAETGQIQASFGGKPAETDDAPKAATPASANGKSKGRMLTRSMMREVKDFTIKPVQMRDTDVYFYVRSLSAEDAFELSRFGDVAESPDGKIEESAKNFDRMLQFIKRSACDEDGVLLFTEPEDDAWLRARKFGSIMDAFQACLDVNGLTKEGLEEVKGN